MPHTWIPPSYGSDGKFEEVDLDVNKMGSIELAKDVTDDYYNNIVKDKGTVTFDLKTPVQSLMGKEFGWDDANIRWIYNLDGTYYTAKYDFGDASNGASEEPVESAGGRRRTRKGGRRRTRKGGRRGSKGGNCASKGGKRGRKSRRR